MTLSVLPVTVVLANFSIFLLANSEFLVVNPGALVLNGFLIGSLGGIGVVALTVTFLSNKNEMIRETVSVSGQRFVH